MRKRELFRSLHYAPHPGQVLVHKSRAPRRVMACGVRFGKSTCAAMEAVAALMEPAQERRGWCVAPTYALAMKVFQRVVDTLRMYLPHRIIKYDHREHHILVRNIGGGTSQLWGKSADAPVGLLGEGLDFLILDEAARLPREIWDAHLSQRLVDREGWALLISTPRGCNWFYSAYQRGQRGRDAAFESWSFPTWDNPHVSRELVEAERGRLEDDVYRQEYGAEFVGAHAEPCDTCKGPDPNVPIYTVVEGVGELPRCPECGELVDDTGHTIMHRGRDGKGVSRVIFLEGPADPSLEDVEPLPGQPGYEEYHSRPPQAPEPQKIKFRPRFFADPVPAS